MPAAHCEWRVFRYVMQLSKDKDGCVSTKCKFTTPDSLTADSDTLSDPATQRATNLPLVRTYVVQTRDVRWNRFSPTPASPVVHSACSHRRPSPHHRLVGASTYPVHFACAGSPCGTGGIRDCGVSAGFHMAAGGDRPDHSHRAASTSDQCLGAPARRTNQPGVCCPHG